MIDKLTAKSSLWAIALVVLVLISAGALKAKQVYSRQAQPIGANIQLTDDANFW